MNEPKMAQVAASKSPNCWSKVICCHSRPSQHRSGAVYNGRDRCEDDNYRLKTGRERVNTGRDRQKDAPDRPNIDRERLPTGSDRSKTGNYRQKDAPERCKTDRERLPTGRDRPKTDNYRLKDGRERLGIGRSWVYSINYANKYRLHDAEWQLWGKKSLPTFIGRLFWRVITGVRPTASLVWFLTQHQFL